MKAWLAQQERGAARAADLISVVVTTYNREDALEAVLRGLSRQTDRSFEIVVADDGSGPQTAHVIEAWSERFPVAIKHVWHADEGFRGGEIRNRGIRASAGRLCIFLDGDCVPRADFIAEHRRLAEPGWFVAGNRILLSRELTQDVLARAREIENWSLGALVRERLRGRINRVIPALRLPLGPLRRVRRAEWRGAQTCNLAVARADLDAVDGFDGVYTGWGLEDSDLVLRLLHAGVRRKEGWCATDVLHLWHPRHDRSQLAANRARLDEVMRGGRVRATQGLSSLVEASAPAREEKCARRTG
jgi:glycosyltransferase involved in cell wall biosynthesis